MKTINEWKRQGNDRSLERALMSDEVQAFKGPFRACVEGADIVITNTEGDFNMEGLAEPFNDTTGNVHFIANEPENCHIFSVANEWL